MKNDYYCVLSDEEWHSCAHCEFCQCQNCNSYEKDEPSVDELEAEFERIYGELKWS